jgi:hypothetical protein
MAPGCALIVSVGRPQKPLIQPLTDGGLVVIGMFAPQLKQAHLDPRLREIQRRPEAFRAGIMA